jgi:ubiquinone/menaquinone biosynthesis C-methylase UbiE
VGVSVTDSSHEIVASGYDAVYEAMPRSETLRRIWREHAIGPGYPEAFEHISFLTMTEMRRMADALRLAPGSHLVDLACGAGGPGLWLAREAGARLTGVDLSRVAVAKAAERAASVGMAESSRYVVGSFDAMTLPDATADGAMSVDALQYAPDKRAAFREFARIIRPGGRLVFVAFELDSEHAGALPVLGLDTVGDYRPLLADAGFEVEIYEQTERWHDRLTAAYGAVNAAREALVAEMGERAANSLLFETTITLEREPYCGRPFVAATRRD